MVAAVGTSGWGKERLGIPQGLLGNYILSLTHCVRKDKITVLAWALTTYNKKKFFDKSKK